MVRILDTTRAGLTCQAYLWGSAFEREWQRTGRGWGAIGLDPGMTLHEQEKQGRLGGDMSCADVQNKEGLQGCQVVLEPQSVVEKTQVSREWTCLSVTLHLVPGWEQTQSGMALAPVQLVAYHVFIGLTNKEPVTLDGMTMEGLLEEVTFKLTPR